MTKLRRINHKTYPENHHLTQNQNFKCSSQEPASAVADCKTGFNIYFFPIVRVFERVSLNNLNTVFKWWHWTADIPWSRYERGVLCGCVLIFCLLEISLLVPPGQARPGQARSVARLTRRQIWQPARPPSHPPPPPSPRISSIWRDKKVGVNQGLNE